LINGKEDNIEFKIDSLKEIGVTQNQTHHWSEWWMRLPHLRMLSKVFAVESDWSDAPRLAKRHEWG
jgi:hypothetical protein